MRPTRAKLNPIILGWGVAALCVFDAAATQFEIDTGLNGEANPVGARLIQHGWAFVWTWKIVAAVAFLSAVTRLLQTRWGRALVYTVAAAYTVVALLHALIFSLAG